MLFPRGGYRFQFWYPDDGQTEANARPDRFQLSTQCPSPADYARLIAEHENDGGTDFQETIRVGVKDVIEQKTWVFKVTGEMTIVYHAEEEKPQ